MYIIADSAAGTARVRPERPDRRDRPAKKMRQRQKDCSKWEFGECTLKNATATCGAGSKLGTRTGNNCPVKEKQFKCKVKCGEGKLNFKLLPPCETILAFSTFCFPGKSFEFFLVSMLLIKVMPSSGILTVDGVGMSSRFPVKHLKTMLETVHAASRVVVFC